MNKTLLASLSLATCLACSATDAAAQRGGFGRRAAPVDLKNFTFKRVEFVAPSLAQVWGEYGLYLPVGYDDEANANKRYPLAIWLHGMNGDYRRFHNGGSHVLDRLRGEGKIPEMIFVAATAARRTLYLNDERSGDFEDLVVRDLVREVEQKYRVSKRREDRALMGCSVGGMGALKIALKHPDKFGSVAAHSSSIFPANPDDLPANYERQRQGMNRSIGLAEILGDPIDKKRWAEEMPMAMVANMKSKDLAGLRIFFDAGTEDRYGFAKPNSDLHELMKKQQLTHTFEMVQGAGHAWGDEAMDGRLTKSLQFVSASFGKKKAAAEATKKRRIF